MFLEIRFLPKGRFHGDAVTGSCPYVTYQDDKAMETVPSLRFRKRVGERVTDSPSMRQA